MKTFSFILSTLIINTFITFAQYNELFTNEALRIDFVLSGNAQTTNASLFELKKEKTWGGSHKNLVDKFNYGEFRGKLKDLSNGRIIYTRGFCTLYEEWQTTEEADSVNRSFFQSFQCPFPKNKCNLTIEKRTTGNQWETILETYINPKSYCIIQNSLSSVNTKKLIDNGSPDSCVDIVFIAEGYSQREMENFHKDVKKMWEYMVTQAPFDQYKSFFNIWVVDAISKDSGITDPRSNIWKNTALKSGFNTLDSDRYLECLHTFLVRDYAGLVPYDQIYVLANTDKYGGGGIYNHFSLTSAHNERSLTVFIHEFGHSFAGLGDEYYTSDVSYNDFFDITAEPWQANLTTLVNFSSKWKKMVDKDTPIPTPKEEKYFNKTGVFEGGGYVAKGVYRPAYDCRMKSNEAPSFCPVCQKAISEMILFLTR